MWVFYLDIMYLPELENFTSEMLDIISEKNDLFVGSSGSSNILVWVSQRADWKWSELELLINLPQGHLSHVTESDGPLAGAVHKEIALLRMELGGGDNLGELLHVGRLDVHDVEWLVCNLHVPQVDPQIVRGEIGFL